MKFNFEKNIFNIVKKNIIPYKKILLAFSGGLDSTVLLDIINKINNENKYLNIHKKIIYFRVLYINHGLNINSKKWILHCENECKKRNIKLNVLPIIITPNKEGIESSAREARYKTIKNCISNEEVLITAHHQNDQLETILLALKRGSGLNGLSGIAKKKIYYGYRIIRPILKISKKEIKTYAYKHNLNWIEDNTNKNLKFDRNFLRLKILPILYDRWPKFAFSSNRSAEICAEQELLIDILLKKILNKIIQPDKSLRFTELIIMNYIKRMALLRRWLKKFNIKIYSRKKLIFLWKEVALSKNDSFACMIFKKFQIRKFKDRLYILKYPLKTINNKIILYWSINDFKLKLPIDIGILIKKNIKIDNFITEINSNLNNKKNNFFLLNTYKKKIININLDKNQIINIINNKKFFISYNIVRMPLINELIYIRFGPINGSIYIRGRNKGRILKKIWQEFKIPPWERKRIPLLYYNNKLIAAIGVFITKEGFYKNSEKQLNFVWKKMI